MPIACPTCSKVNPSTATYCFYDGRALTQVSQPGPWWLGTMAFQTPFSFSDGQSCGNFNQLALACDRRWNEARSFLGDGIWCSFFEKIGRHDLAVAAVQAAKEPDRDVGLAYLLGRLPTDAVRQPALSLISATEDLGTLEPGKDHKFEVVISNKGSLVLSGSVLTDCEWLFFGDRQGNVSRKLFQTRDNYTLFVQVIGSKLRAGRKPLEGQIEIETNGGNITVAVKAMVPIQPFPKGASGNHVLAGAKSPREVALKAKTHPQEASALFEQGAVEAWYTSNGWDYPIRGTRGKGKAAVQQYFEALGVTKPPLLEIDTERIACRGEAGRRLTKHVTISTKEAKFVNAEAHSDQTWIKIQPGISEGNLVTIPLLIEIPRGAGESLHANVTVQGNGQQRFVVPVALTVVAGTRGEDEDDSEEDNSGGSRRWILAGVGAALVLLLALGSIFLVKNNRQVAVPRITEPVIVPPVEVEPPPKQLAKTETWWDGIPEQKLAAGSAELKANVQGDSQAIFDGLSAKSDTDRFKSYEQLAAKLPDLMRNVKTREPLSRFLTECCVHEPSELNISHVRRALAGQFPKDGDVFRAEEKGEELENALYARQILFAAMKHKAVTPDRVRSLANELGTVFGLALDTSARPDELEAETEKLLAVRCYRNILPTATKSIDHAVTTRDLLIEKFPKHLPRAFRDPIDADLLVTGLAKGDEEFWPKLQPIFESCLASNDANVNKKIVAVYAKGNADLARKMEPLMVPKWKVAGNAKMTQAEKVVAIAKILTVDPDKPKITLADRLGQLRKLTDSTLTVVAKPGQKSEIDHLMHAVRLAHVSTLGSILFNKDAEVERFDALVSRVPESKVAPPAPAVEGKKPVDKPKDPVEVEPKVIDVEGQPYTITHSFTKSSEREPTRGTFRKKYSVSMKVGQLYTIDLQSTEFNTYLRLETSGGRQVAVADTRGGTPNSRITYVPQAAGIFRVVATTIVKGATGSYTLQIEQGGSGRLGPGMPFPPLGRGFPPRFGPGLPFFPVMPAQPKPAAPKATEKEEQVSKSDLSSLANTQKNTRVTAFNNLVGSLPNDLKPQFAEKIAAYLLVTIGSEAEVEEVSGKLESLANCRHLLLALADLVGSNDKVTQPRTEAIVGGILGQRLRFARDEDWRSASRKLILQRALDLTVISATAANADLAADFLRDLYKEQGLAFGLEKQDFLDQTQPVRVLEALIEHVAVKAAKKVSTPAEKEYLEQIDRHLKAAEFVADNHLENMVLLQRIWIKVLTVYLQELVPTQAKSMSKIQQDLATYDLDSRNVFDQLRVAEEKILRLWTLANDLKGS